jgi:acetylornithine deacetylase
VTDKSVITLLEELVAIASPSGDEGAAATYVVDHLRAHGVEAEHLGETVLARVTLGSGGPRVLLNSHLDTVPVGEGWTRKPLGEWDGDRLYGRGSNDAKASAASMTWAVCDLARSAADIKDVSGEVWLALTACEETSNAGMHAVVEREGSFDAAVTGEPTGLEVVRSQSGLAVLVARWTGRSCHAAHVARVDHDNALAKAAAELASVTPFVTLDGEHELLGPSTVVPSVFTSGARHNVVPDLAEVVFDARIAPPHTAQEVAELLSARMPQAEVRIRSDRLVPVEAAADHPVVQAALRSAGREEAIGSATMSDMALLSGTPSVKCGPGQTVRSHTTDEFVLRSEVEAGAAFYRKFATESLKALAAVEPLSRNES